MELTIIASFIYLRSVPLLYYFPTQGKTERRTGKIFTAHA